MVSAMADPRPSLIEFPADDPARARRFWGELLGVELEARAKGEGAGWQTEAGEPAVGVHERGRGPGDSFSLPYFAVSDMRSALENGRVSSHASAGTTSTCASIRRRCVGHGSRSSRARSARRR